MKIERNLYEQEVTLIEANWKALKKLWSQEFYGPILNTLRKKKIRADHLRASRTLEQRKYQLSP